MTTPRQEQENAAARAEIAAAVERAAAEGKHVLVVFGADWCPDSAALEDLFTHPLVSALLEAGFEVVHLDAGNRDRHLALARGWGLDYAAGIPTVAVLDPHGELLHATRNGELRTARTLSPLDLATRIHRWMPEGATG